MEHAKNCETQENWMKQKGKLCFAETIHDIHGNVEVKNRKPFWQKRISPIVLQV